jgi:peptidoglycan hydrolase-like protein with peptidoglycan-binding domain
MKKLAVFLVFSVLFLSACRQRIEKVEAPLVPPANQTQPEMKVLEENPALVQTETAAQATVSTAPIEVAPPKETGEKSKQTMRDIQAALKNAGFYEGKIDGIFGPKTKKAIEEFQAKNNLKVDGKVGPKTWSMLSAYLQKE